MSIKKLKELAVDHPYYCSESNYYSREPGETYQTMTDFLNEFEDADVDMNLCFRWDIYQKENSERFYGEVFLMLQRKGIFMPCRIDDISEQEVDRFEVYAKKHFATLMAMWAPIGI